MAIAATRFMVFLMIMHAMPRLEAGRGMVFLVLVLLGAVWASGLGLLRRALAQDDDDREPVPQRPPASAQQKFSRWRRSLDGLTGWSYCIRITAGVTCGVALEHVWPSHHLHWVGLTVVLLAPRHQELLSPKTTQRAIGTAIGVAATGIALRAGLPVWAVVAAIALFAGLRPLLRAGNYLLYSAVMTPMVILVIDAGHVPDTGLLLDRLLATVLGAALVVATNAAVIGCTRSRAQA
jgi:uncharacterized membrane protein YccC